MEKENLPERNEVSPEHAWNAESVFESREHWEIERSKLSEDLSGMERYTGRLGESPETLTEAFHWLEGLRQRLSKIILYAGLSHKVDTTDQVSAEMFSRAQSLEGKVNGATAFFEPELLMIGEETLDKWMRAPGPLAPFTHYLRDLFRRGANIRTPEVEELLGMLSEPFSGTSTTGGLLTNADFRFKEASTRDGGRIPVSQGTIDKVLAGGDREARRTAWENYTDRYLAFKNTLAGNLATSIKQNVFTTRARRYPSSLEGALFTNNLPVEVYHNLLEAFRKNLPLWHRYWSIRKRALGVETLHPYDIWAPLTDQKPQVPYEKAVEWICRGLAPLGEEYVHVMRKGCLEDRWVDRSPNRGKTAGAFSWGTQGTYPFVVMSYTDDVGSLSTLAHELGHSMHSYLTWKHQPPVYSEYSIFAAEVASNFHQAMVRDELLKKESDSALQMGLLEEAMSNFHRYLFIMPMLARFELETHRRIEEGKGLTAGELIDLMADLFSEGYGEWMHVDRDRVGITWATFGHLYSDYYVFQYTTGISGAHALMRRILSGEPGAVDDYLNFLKAGSSLYPLDALKRAGVDLSSTLPIEETFLFMSDILDRLERILGSEAA
jgi:oligoendopeptidase F